MAADASILPANRGGARQHHLSTETCDSCSADEFSFDGDEFNFVESSHAIHVLNGLDGLRQSRTFCDVTLCVGDNEFACHKIVLASFSPYFNAMFSGELAESRQEKVAINGIDAAMLELLVNYAYTSMVLITKVNVQSLLSAANLLEVLPVRDACCHFMQGNMDETNCLGIHCFAEAHACVNLQEKAKTFTLDFFDDVWPQEEFLSLPQSKLIEFVSSDDLCVDNEEVVFNAVMRWLRHDEAAHGVDLHKVLEHVRLPLLSPYFLHDCVAAQNVIAKSAECQVLLEEAKTYHLLQDRRAELRTSRTRPRKASGTLTIRHAYHMSRLPLVTLTIDLSCLPFIMLTIRHLNNSLTLSQGVLP